MRTPEVMYLEDVLGIEGYVRPVSEAVAAVSETIVALSDVPLVNGRHELLKKMLASIQVHDFLAVDCTQEDHSKLRSVRPKAVVYLGEKTPELMQGWAGNFSELTQTVLPSLEELTDTSNPARLQTLKKEAWARLQSFQREI